MKEVSFRVREFVDISLGRDTSPEAFFTPAVVGGAFDFTD
jgi:hypothetical protein